MADIDRDKLKSLASDPNESSESISEKLGLGKAHNLHYHLKKDPELKRIYNQGREVAGKARKTSAKAPRKGTKKSAAPPARTVPNQARANYSWRRSSSNLITSMCTEVDVYFAIVLAGPFQSLEALQSALAQVADDYLSKNLKRIGIE